MPKYTVILFYKFINIEEPEKLRDTQLELCRALELTGRMLIAHEGINGTFEGTQEAIAQYADALHANPLFADVVIKESEGTGLAFHKLDIKVRDEVVTLGAGTLDPAIQTAPVVTADELQAMYEDDEDFVVLDLRNEYEIATGRFEKTVHPNLTSFRDLPEKLPALEYLKNKKVVAVCTGGIRCEKATRLLKTEGFTNLYQLQDGIHTYMQQYPQKNFKGTLYVFDNRMTTDVIDTPGREIIGRCAYCKTECERYYNDDSVRPSRKVLCCDACITEHTSELRSVV